MPAINYHGDIYIDRIAILQALFTRDTVANDVVDRRTNGLGKSPISQRRRYCATVNGEFVTKLI